MTFQALDGKGNQFLDLLDDDLNVIELSYSKGGPWLQVFGHSNLLCARAVRAITNHAPIGEYRLWFFPNMDFTCPCNNYPIETRRYILHECRRFSGYWNPRRDMLSHFVMFLSANLNAFAFINNLFLFLVPFSCWLVLLYFLFLLFSFFPFSFFFFYLSLLASCWCASIVCSYESSYHGLPLYAV